MDWPSLEIAKSQSKSRISRKPGKLCIESHSGVSILVTAVITAIAIAPANY